VRDLQPRDGNSIDIRSWIANASSIAAQPAVSQQAVEGWLADPKFSDSLVKGYEIGHDS
jgi:hypothetical protein